MHTHFDFVLTGLAQWTVCHTHFGALDFNAFSSCGFDNVRRAYGPKQFAFIAGFDLHFQGNACKLVSALLRGGSGGGDAAALAPSPMVDMLWHTHMLFPREYAADCRRLAGCFLDHDDDIEHLGG